MKRIALLFGMSLIVTFAMGQRHQVFENESNEDDNISFIRKGRILIETGYSTFNTFGTGGTGVSVLSVDNESLSSFAVDGGYFVSENFALKFQYSNLSSGGNGISVFGVGGKYYIANKVPLELIASRYSGFGSDQTFVNLNIGYAIPLADNITLEPAIGILVTSDEDDDGLGLFSISFAMFL